MADFVRDFFIFMPFVPELLLFLLLSIGCLIVNVIIDIFK